MAVAKKTPTSKDVAYSWEGTDKSGKTVKGEMIAGGEAVVSSTLRRQGINVKRIKKKGNLAGSKKITAKDVALFTRQLATMMKSGVPLLQAFDIVAKGHANPAVQKLLIDIKTDIEGGTSLSKSFAKHPLYFDTLYVNLVDAGEQAGILDGVLDRLATYQEKIIAIKGKIKSALFYPLSIIVVAFVITAVIMLFVVPAFKELFSSFGADLPAPTLIMMSISDFFVQYWWLIFGSIGGGFWFFFYTWKRSIKMQEIMDRAMLKMPIFGVILEKAAIARWTRTLSTMFAAGVPLVEALNSVAGAAGNIVFYHATMKIKAEVTTGTNLTIAMQNTHLFPNMVQQMVQIGEESGALDSMLSKVADFYEAEVDDAVASISSLMEPVIMVILGGLIGSMVVAMYLPIFKMGSVVG
ncbi:type II secretion system F family protein [Sulfuriferula nivalis]|uniref:Type II secretion system protein F n=1 Tax=Sulfuriferula nivalis TaxID=2675298 RepID=A0A809RMM2_9PROT|nr:type II secretion system F family protein [Sulfuriferula nivalis]BBP02034.1 type II secretion system protein F [Sulfuriferula nivalis]